MHPVGHLFVLFILTVSFTLCVTDTEQRYRIDGNSIINWRCEIVSLFDGFDEISPSYKDIHCVYAKSGHNG
jgi:hypothetical protein